MGLRARVEAAALKKLGPTGIVDLGLRLGPYGVRAGRDGLSVKKLRSQPSGVDLGAHVPRLPRAMKRWRDRIDLAPPAYLEDLARLRAPFEGPAEEPAGELRLVGRRHVRSNNSWTHNVPRLMAGKPICTLLMHPDDAAARELKPGARVRVRSRVGEIEVPVEVSDDMMPGVVSLPHGFGHGRSGTRQSVAQAHAGASINDLTDEQLIDELTGNAAFSGVPVQVVAVSA